MARRIPRLTYTGIGLFMFFLILNSCKSVQLKSSLSDEQYKVLNDFFDRSEGYTYYYKTVESPPWEQLFNNYDSIFQRAWAPTKITDEELFSLLSEKDLKTIRAQIKKNSPVVLNQDKLVNLDLTKRKKKSLAISSPIILEDLAIIRRIGDSEVPIFILSKNENGKWEYQFAFYQKLILY